MMVTEKDVFEAMLEKAEKEFGCPDKLCKDCEVDCICKEFALINGRDEEFDLYNAEDVLEELKNPEYDGMYWGGYEILDGGIIHLDWRVLDDDEYDDEKYEFYMTNDEFDRLETMLPEQFPICEHY